jgi:single-strand DNA-binding protein
MSEHNLAVLRGTVAGDTRARDLPSGSTLIQLDLTTRDDSGTYSVPVAWFDPPAAAADLAAGMEVIVVGTVRRRFFRAGGATQSRTEVVADRIVPTRRIKDVQRSLDQPTRWLANLAP